MCARGQIVQRVAALRWQHLEPGMGRGLLHPGDDGRQQSEAGEVGGREDEGLVRGGGFEGSRISDVVGQQLQCLRDAAGEFVSARRGAHDASPMHSPTFRQAAPQDADRCFEIESTAYEGDEAATLPKIRKRIAEYPEGFLLMELDGRVIGFINSGCTHQVVMADEAFKELVSHDARAPNVVIMSVVVDPAFQGRGYASTMMRTFVERMRQAGKQTIHLMCKERHVDLYARQGYRYVKPSASDHGGMAWHEMEMPL